MNSNKYTKISLLTIINLIGESNHRQFLKSQVAYGYSHRGGVAFPFTSNEHGKRLVSSVNILTSLENKHLIFSESIFSN